MMDSIANSLINDLLSGGNLSAVCRAVGGNEPAVSSAISMAVPLILGSMAHSASNPNVEQSLFNMIAGTSRNNPTYNLGGYLNNPGMAAGMAGGPALLGSHMDPIQNIISQRTGLHPTVVARLLVILVPLILGHLGRTVGQQRVMNPGGLRGFLESQSGMAAQATPEAANMARAVSGTGDSRGFLSALKNIFG